MILFLLFVIIPLTEIGLFILVGGEIGIISTLLLCVLTAIIGAALIRVQGIQTLFSARTALGRGQLPVTELFDGLCLAVAGALLMTPGFFTDGLGFSLLVPRVRIWLRHFLAERFDLELRGEMHGRGPASRRHPGDPDIIEAEYERIDTEERERP